MIMTSFQYNFDEVIESSLKFKFNLSPIDRLSSTVRRKARYSTSSAIFPISPKTKSRRTVLTQKMLSLKLSTWPCGKS